MSATLLYKPTVSGLWGHSHEGESDLMKQFVIERRTPSGWMGVKSFEVRIEAEVFASTVNQLTENEYRVFDQFA